MTAQRKRGKEPSVLLRCSRPGCPRTRRVRMDASMRVRVAEIERLYCWAANDPANVLLHDLTARLEAVLGEKARAEERWADLRQMWDSQNASWNEERRGRHAAIAERDRAAKRSQYWKDEHTAANAEIEALATANAALVEEIDDLREVAKDCGAGDHGAFCRHYKALKAKNAALTRELEAARTLERERWEQASKVFGIDFAARRTAETKEKP